MATSPDLTFDFTPSGRSGHGILLASLGGQPIVTQRLDIASTGDRPAYAAALCQDRPGIDQALVVADLEKLAGNVIATQSDSRAAGDRERVSQAEALVTLATEAGTEFFHNDETPYCTVPSAAAAHGVGRRETLSLKGLGFRSWLARQYWTSAKKAAGGQAVQDAIGVLTGKALFEGPQMSVFTRVAGVGADAVYLDLTDDAGRVVEVTADGWRMLEASPVKFVRRRGMQPLPVPQQGGGVEELRELINVGSDADFHLIVAWLVGALRPTGPYPVLAVNGEQGSAKSTTCRALRRLIDPNVADLRSAPRDERDLMIAANNSWVIGFDNLSSISPALSDALCRLATGGAFATRELYSDDGERLFSATRPILFNGIEELATRPDLLERAVVLNLPTIAEDRRRTQEDMSDRFEKSRPRVLGALLDAVSAAIRGLPDVRLDRMPRMADFARWVTAAEPALPWHLGQFAAAYGGNQDAANELALEASAVGPAVVSLVSVHGEWTGTASELLRDLEGARHSDPLTRQRPDWPKTSSRLTNALRRLAPTLRRLGVDLDFHRTAASRQLVLRRGDLSSSPPASSQGTACAGLAARNVTVDDDLPF